MEDRLKRLSKIINALQEKAQKQYDKHPNDLIDLGEVQAYKRCSKEINKIIEGVEK